MTDFTPSGLAGVPAQASEAAAALAALRGPGESAAQAIDDAFSKAGASLTRSLTKAAADGKITLAELAQAVIGAVDAAAGSSGSGGGLGAALGGILTAAFSGARADGGPVSAGGAYLVGERGPEVFRPASAGVIEPASASGLTVNLTLQGADGPSLVRSEAQIAQALARAVSLGARGL